MARIDSKGIRDVVSASGKKKKKAAGSKKDKQAFSIIRAIRDLLEGKMNRRAEIDRKTR